MTYGLIKGTERQGEELVFTAHLYEGWAKQGANDNASGCAAILETARVLTKLVAEGKIPPLKRSVRFLFVPEISGTDAYLRLNPDIKKRIFADINLDMVGEGLIKNQSFFRLNQTPWSLPTWLNDVMASYVEWMGDSQRDAQESNWQTGGVLAPTGSRDPFYFLVERYSGGSDHDVFVDGGVRIPAVLLIVWPDQWYHTSGDTPDKSDPTQFKRVVTISAAAAEFLANAGPAEAERMLAEISARRGGRLGEDKGRAERLLLAADAETVHAAAREARVIVDQGFVREKKTVASVGFFFGAADAADAALKGRLAGMDSVRAAHIRSVDDLYAARCKALGVRPEKAGPTKDEARLAGLVPVRTEKMGGLMSMWNLRDELRKLDYQPPPSIRMAERELRNFIDGERSVLDIRDAASAEYEPLDLLEVEKWVGIQEKLGLVTVKKNRNRLSSFRRLPSKAEREPPRLFREELLQRRDQVHGLFELDQRDLLGLGDGREAAVRIPFLVDEQDGRVRGHGVDGLLVGRVAGGRALGAALQAFDVGADDPDALLAGLGDEGGGPGQLVLDLDAGRAHALEAGAHGDDERLVGGAGLGLGLERFRRRQRIDVEGHLQPLHDDLDGRRGVALAAGGDEDGQLGLGLGGLAQQGGGNEDEGDSDGGEDRGGPMESGHGSLLSAMRRAQEPMLGQRPGPVNPPTGREQVPAFIGASSMASSRGTSSVGRRPSFMV